MEKALLFILCKSLCHDYNVTINAAVYILYKVLYHNFSPLVWKMKETFV